MGGRRQFYDLVEIFRIGGFAPYTNYLFLGPLACPFSLCEWLGMTSCSRRLRRPRALQRRDHLTPDLPEAPVPRPGAAHSRKSRVPGSHAGKLFGGRAANVADAANEQTYGFYSECVRKYGSPAVWTYFTDMFDFLTLSVVIDDRLFCVHGGQHRSAVLSVRNFADHTDDRPLAFYTLHRPDQNHRSVSRYAKPFGASVHRALMTREPQKYHMKGRWPI